MPKIGTDSSRTTEQQQSLLDRPIQEAEAEEAKSSETSSDSTEPQTSQKGTNESREIVAKERQQNTSGSGQSEETLLIQTVRGYKPETEPQTQATALLNHLKKQTSTDTTNDNYSDYTESTQATNPTLQVQLDKQKFIAQSRHAQQAARQLSNEQNQKIIKLSEELIKLGKSKEVTQALKDLTLHPQNAQKILSDLKETKNKADIEAFYQQQNQDQNEYDKLNESLAQKDKSLSFYVEEASEMSFRANNPQLKEHYRDNHKHYKEMALKRENQRKEQAKENRDFVQSEEFKNARQNIIDNTARQLEIERLIEQGDTYGASQVAQGEKYESEQEILLTELELTSTETSDKYSSLPEEQSEVLEYKDRLDEDISQKQAELQKLVDQHQSQEGTLDRSITLSDRASAERAITEDLPSKIVELTQELEKRQQVQELLASTINEQDYQSALALINGEKSATVTERYNQDYSKDNQALAQDPHESVQERLFDTQERLAARQEQIDQAQERLTRHATARDQSKASLESYTSLKDGYDSEASYLDYNNTSVSYSDSDYRAAQRGIETSREKYNREKGPASYNQQRVLDLNNKQKEEAYRLSEAQALFDLGEVKKAKAVLEGESVEIQSEIKISIDLDEYRVTDEELASFKLSDEEYQSQQPSKEEMSQMGFEELQDAAQLILKNQAFRQLSPEARVAKIAEIEAFKQKPQSEQDAILYRQAVTDSVTQLQEQIKQIEEQQRALFQQNKDDTKLAQRQEQIGLNEKLTSQLTRALTDFQTLQIRLTELAEAGDYDEMNRYRTGEKSIEVTRSFADKNQAYIAARQEVALTTQEKLQDIETLTALLGDKQESLEIFRDAMRQGFIQRAEDFLELNPVIGAALATMDLLADFESDILKDVEKQADLARHLTRVLDTMDNIQSEVRQLLAQGNVTEAREKLKNLLTFSTNEYSSGNKTMQKYFTAQQGELERNIDSVLETGRKVGIMVVATGVTIATAGASTPLTMPLIYGTAAGTAFGFGSEILVSQTDSNKTLGDGVNSAFNKLPGDFLLALQSSGSTFAALTVTRGLEALAKLQQAGQLGTQSKFASTIANVLAKTSPATQNILIGGSAGGSSASVGMLKDSFEVALQRIELADKIKEENPDASPEKLKELTEQAYKENMLDMESIIKRNYYAFLSGVASGGLGRYAGGLSQTSNFNSNFSKIALTAAEETANIAIASAELLAQGIDPNSEEFAQMLYMNVAQAALTKLSAKITEGDAKPKPGDSETNLKAQDVVIGEIDSIAYKLEQGNTDHSPEAYQRVQELIDSMDPNHISAENAQQINSSIDNIRQDAIDKGLPAPKDLFVVRASDDLPNGVQAQTTVVYDNDGKPVSRDSVASPELIARARSGDTEAQAILKEEALAHGKEKPLDPLKRSDGTPREKPMPQDAYIALRAQREIAMRVKGKALQAQADNQSFSASKQATKQALAEMNEQIKAGKYEEALRIAEENGVGQTYRDQYTKDYEHNIDPNRTHFEQTDFSAKEQLNPAQKLIEEQLGDRLDTIEDIEGARALLVNTETNIRESLSEALATQEQNILLRDLNEAIELIAFNPGVLKDQYLKPKFDDLLKSAASGKKQIAEHLTILTEITSEANLRNMNETELEAANQRVENISTHEKLVSEVEARRSQLAELMDVQSRIHQLEAIAKTDNNKKRNIKKLRDKIKNILDRKSNEAENSEQVKSAQDVMKAKLGEISGLKQMQQKLDAMNPEIVEAAFELMSLKRKNNENPIQIRKAYRIAQYLDAIQNMDNFEKYLHNLKQLNKYFPNDLLNKDINSFKEFKSQDNNFGSLNEKMQGVFAERNILLLDLKQGRESNPLGGTAITSNKIIDSEGKTIVTTHEIQYPNRTEHGLSLQRLGETDYIVLDPNSKQIYVRNGDNKSCALTMSDDGILMANGNPASIVYDLETRKYLAREIDLQTKGKFGETQDGTDQLYFQEVKNAASTMRNKYQKDGGRQLISLLALSKNQRRIPVIRINQDEATLTNPRSNDGFSTDDYTTYNKMIDIAANRGQKLLFVDMNGNVLNNHIQQHK